MSPLLRTQSLIKAFPCIASDGFFSHDPPVDPALSSPQTILEWVPTSQPPACFHRCRTPWGMGMYGRRVYLRSTAYHEIIHVPAPKWTHDFLHTKPSDYNSGHNALSCSWPLLEISAQSNLIVYSIHTHRHTHLYMPGLVYDSMAFDKYIVIYPTLP